MENVSLDDHSSKFTSGVRVIVQDLSENPQCAHGPTLLFSRLMKGGEERRFYACSACRDRKECTFFMWADQSLTKKEYRRDSVLPKFDLEKHTIRISKLLDLPSNRRAYCHNCNCLFNLKRQEKHSKHEVISDVSDYQIRHPSKLLKQLESSKKEAQYMFSEKSVKTICDILRDLNVTYVICIGAPRIHEHILQEFSPKMSSILLDLDKRYHEFFKSTEFCHFNMFNNHFFDGKEAQKPFMDIISDINQEVAIMIDPPFGGRVEPLVHTLQSLQSLRQNIPTSVKPMPVVWAFPYFMEPHIKGSCPGYAMLDYKVEYENHLQFKTGNSNRGSPVRLFTNVSPNKVVLPKNEGYRHCFICDRWVSRENKHCYICNCCTSKDGRTYVHCKKCKRCVKPSWSHCSTCNRCCLPNHACGVKPPTPIACFCGSLDHIRKDCPLVKKTHGHPKTSKRKSLETQGNVKNKKGKMNNFKASNNNSGKKKMASS